MAILNSTGSRIGLGNRGPVDHHRIACVAAKAISSRPQRLPRRHRYAFKWSAG